MRGGEQSIFDLAMIAEELRQEVLGRCYQEGVKVYGIFVDDRGALWKRFLSDDGAERGEVVGAYVEGSNGFYRKRKCCQNYA
jgi:hypothetical protein